MNKRPFVAAAVTLVTALVISKLAGMTPSVEAPQDASRGASTGQEPREESEARQPLPQPSEQPLPVRAAVEAFAVELDLAPDAVQVLKVEAVTWPDGSLGCPQPGMQYMQVLTEGFRIELEAQGERAEYHTDRQTQAVRCLDGPGTVGAPID